MKRTGKRKRYKIMWIIFAIIILSGTGIVLFLNQPSFGRLPKGERLERIKNSPHYREGSFKNLNETPQLTSDKSFFEMITGFLFQKTERLKPANPLPAIKTDLKKLNRDQDIMVWFGHGSYLLQTGGKRFLIDPVFTIASPVSFYNKAFKGTDIYKPEDMPDIDFLVISHDHWDHLDYKTVKEIKNRTAKVICPLGVGEHFEYWGYDKNQLIELDWNESHPLSDSLTVYCLPARHFSGRRLKPNQTLWASFLLETSSGKIFIGGDGGYDTHFAEIGKRFAPIDFAILENGQYDADWSLIHLMPDKLPQVISDLNAKKGMTVHNSKYALAKHAWDAPLVNVAAWIQKDSLPLITPMIGEVVYFKEDSQTFNNWWENIE